MVEVHITTGDVENQITCVIPEDDVGHFLIEKGSSFARQYLTHIYNQGYFKENPYWTLSKIQHEDLVVSIPSIDLHYRLEGLKLGKTKMPSPSSSKEKIPTQTTHLNKRAGVVWPNAPIAHYSGNTDTDDLTGPITYQYEECNPGSPKEKEPIRTSHLNKRARVVWPKAPVAHYGNTDADDLTGPITYQYEECNPGSPKEKEPIRTSHLNKHARVVWPKAPVAHYGNTDADDLTGPITYQYEECNPGSPKEKEPIRTSHLNKRARVVWPKAPVAHCGNTDADDLTGPITYQYEECNPGSPKEKEPIRTSHLNKHARVVWPNASVAHYSGNTDADNLTGPITYQSEECNPGSPKENESIQRAVPNKHARVVHNAPVAHYSGNTDAVDLTGPNTYQPEECNPNSPKDKSPIRTADQTQEKSTNYFWTDNATKNLIDLYKEKQELFLNRAIKKKTLWKEISKKLSENGFGNPTDTQVEDKFKNLRRSYAKVKDAMGPNSSGAPAPEKFKFFYEIDEIFAKNPSFDPPLIIGSRRANEVIVDDIEEQINKPKKMTKTKIIDKIIKSQETGKQEILKEIQNTRILIAEKLDKLIEKL